MKISLAIYAGRKCGIVGGPQRVRTLIIDETGDTVRCPGEKGARFEQMPRAIPRQSDEHFFQPESRNTVGCCYRSTYKEIQCGNVGPEGR